MSHIGNFWSEADGAPLVILTDFDYTITTADVGDLITETLAPPSREVVERYEAQEIGTRKYWAESMARVEPAEGARLADSIPIDPAFPEFARWCQSEQIPLAIVSDGFWFYIQRVLNREGLAHLPVFCNEMEKQGSLSFPHGNPICQRCGVCKAGISRRAQMQGAHVVYIGDGLSDLYAATFADWVFAKGRLARYMVEKGSPFFAFASFADVQAHLARDLSRFRDGSAEGRATLGQSEVCRFEPGERPGGGPAKR